MYDESSIVFKKVKESWDQKLEKKHWYIGIGLKTVGSGARPPVEIGALSLQASWPWARR